MKLASLVALIILAAASAAPAQREPRPWRERDDPQPIPDPIMQLQARIHDRIQQLASDDPVARADAEHQLFNASPFELHFLRAAAMGKDAKVAKVADALLVSILKDRLPGWLEGAEIAQVCFNRPGKLDPKKLEALRAHADELMGPADKTAAMNPDFEVLSSSGPDAPNSQLLIALKVTPARLKQLSEIQTYLEPEGFRLADRVNVLLYKANDKYRKQAREMIPAFTAKLEKALQASYPGAKVELQKKYASSIAEITCSVSDVAGQLVFRETDRVMEYVTAEISDLSTSYPHAGFTFQAYFHAHRYDNDPKARAVYEDTLKIVADCLTDIQNFDNSPPPPATEPAPSATPPAQP